MMRVIGDRVLVLLPPKATEQEDSLGFTYQARTVTPSGLILARPADTYDVEIATRGIVVQLGTRKDTISRSEAVDALAEGRLDTLAPAPFPVSVGDCIVFPPSAGEQIVQDGLTYLILREDDILGIVEPRGRERAWLDSLAGAVAEALALHPERTAA
mgnify:CR=1 FL=1